MATAFMTATAIPWSRPDTCPLHWRYDLNPATNPYMMERIGVNAAFNAGAIKWEGKYVLVVRVEGADRKSFFAVAESPNGVDNFRFWDEPVTLPETDDPDTNVYDMRLTRHEDGWIYGLFCSERKDPAAPAGDLSSAVAAAGIVRTKDLKTWGTPARPAVCQPAAQCGVAPGVCQREICLVHPPAGWLHRHRPGRRHRLGVG